MIDPVVVCRSDVHRVAIPLVVVQEVTWVAETTPLPGAPPWWSGLLDLRGEILPVLDVGALIERRASAPVLSDLVLICREGEQLLGLLVHDVIGVAALEAVAVNQVPREAWIREVLQDRDGLVLLLDLDSVGSSL